MVLGLIRVCVLNIHWSGVGLKHPLGVTERTWLRSPQDESEPELSHILQLCGLCQVYQTSPSFGFLPDKGSSKVCDVTLSCFITTESPSPSDIPIFCDGYFTGEIRREKNRATNASSPRSFQSLVPTGPLWSFRTTCCNSLTRNEGLSMGRSSLLRPEPIWKTS